MKSIKLLILINFAIFLLACTKTATQSKEIDVYVGTEGLTAEFTKNAPPLKVFEESSFPILLRIINNGAYSIPAIDKTPGVLSIGRERDYIPSITVEQNDRLKLGQGDNEIYFSVDGKTKINPKGDEIIVSINAKTGKLDPQSEIKASTITATLCYPYKTILSATACIDTDHAGIIPGKKACTIKELAFNNGQGAPIAVAKIEQQMILIGDKIKPQFLIFVENKGRGNPVGIGNYHSICTKSDFNEANTNTEKLKNIWNVAYIKAFTAGEGYKSQLVCCPNLEGKCDENENTPEKMTGFVRFRDKKDFVRCIFKEGIEKNFGAYTSPLRIEIDYGYVHTITANFEIQKPLKY